MRHLRLIWTSAGLACGLVPYVPVALVPAVLAPVVFSAAAFGQETHPAGMQPWTVDSYLDKLGQHMAIKPRQKPAWNSYSSTLASVSKDAQAQHHTNMEAMGTASWQERCSMVDDMLADHKEAAEKAHKAAAELWPALDSAQKQKAKSMLPGLVLPPAAGFG